MNCTFCSVTALNGAHYRLRSIPDVVGEFQLIREKRVLVPGTRLPDPTKSEGDIALDTFPADWKYCTLTFPVARYKYFSLDSIVEEMHSCDRKFYSMPRILCRVWSNLWRRRAPLTAMLGALSYRINLLLNLLLNCRAYAEFRCQRGHRSTGRHDAAESIVPSVSGVGRLK